MEREGTGRRPAARVVGRYAIHEAIAAGGMATVHVGRLIGPIGFSRTVAIKRLHVRFARDPEFTAMLLDEARVASRIRHPNVVPVIDVVAEDGELLLVMEYVHGEPLSILLRAHTERTPERARVVANVVAGALHGLHAAHETCDDGGQPLGIVHRDVSPENVLLGLDGIPRVVDFGVARAAGQLHCTATGRVKGKIRYLAPEQLRRSGLDRRADVWSASVMLWEGLTGRRLFSGDNPLDVMKEVLEKPIPAPSEIAPDVPEPLACVVLRGLARDPSQRFATAVEMAAAIEDAAGLVSPREVGAWVERAARGRLETRRRLLYEIESAAVTPVTATATASAANVDAMAVPVGPPSGATTLEPTSVRRPPPRPWIVPVSTGAALITAAAIVATAALLVSRGGGPVVAAPPLVNASASAPPLVSASAPPVDPAPSCVAVAPSASAALPPGVRVRPPRAAPRPRLSH
jgi:hypothetical protein